MTAEQSATNCAANTDRELWREREGDYYADSIHVTERGGIGVNVGGMVYVKPVREWHRLAKLDEVGALKSETRAPAAITEERIHSILAERFDPHHEMFRKARKCVLTILEEDRASRSATREPRADRRKIVLDWVMAEIDDTEPTNVCIDRLLAALDAVPSSSAQPSDVSATRETGWLVENGGSGEALRYRTIEQGLPVWTTDHNKAIRFARRADAEMFAAEDNDAWRIAEHQWG